MVDTISSANSVRKVGTGATHHRSPPGTSNPAAGSKAVEQVSAAGDPAQHESDSNESDQREPDRRGNSASDLRLEISEDTTGGELVYRFVDAQTGHVVGEWDADQMGKLREYLRAKNIHIFDKKV